MTRHISIPETNAAQTQPPVLGHPANSGHRVDINAATAVARHARFRPDSPAVVYEGGDLTYGELDDRAARLASVLADGGTSEGDRVAYLGLNSLSFLVTMLAAFRLGAIFVPINFRLAGPELESVLVRSGANDDRVRGGPSRRRRRGHGSPALSQAPRRRRSRDPDHPGDQAMDRLVGVVGRRDAVR